MRLLTYTHNMCMILVGVLSLKRRDLIKKLKAAGFVFDRSGHDHDIYCRGADEEQIPRHREIKEPLAKAILRKWGIK